MSIELGKFWDENKVSFQEKIRLIMVIWNTPEIAQNPLILGNTQAITVRFRDSKQTATYLKTQMRIILALNLKFTRFLIFSLAACPTRRIDDLILVKCISLGVSLEIPRMFQ